MINENKNLCIPKNEKSITFANWFHCISTMSLIDASVKPLFDENLKRYEDWDLWIRLYKQGYKPAFCDKVLFSTYNRPNGITNYDKDDIKKNTEIIFKKHSINPKLKLADIIIPHQNRHDHLKNCLEKLDYRQFNIIVVSGGSFSENCNKGARIAETDNLIFLNDDTLPDNDILKEMAENDADIVGVAEYIPDYKKVFYGIGYYLKNGMVQAGLTGNRQDVTIPSGYCFKVKKEVWQKLNGLSEDFVNGGEDQDFGFRAIEQDYTIDYILKPMTHFLSQSADRFIKNKENLALLDKLWSSEKLIKLLKL